MILSRRRQFKYLTLALVIVSIYLLMGKRASNNSADPLKNFNNLITITEKNSQGIQQHDLFSNGEVGLCDVIHVVTFIQSSKFNFNLMTFLKRILLSRRNPLKLYIVVDDSSTKPLAFEMLDSWQVEGIEFVFYEIQTLPNLQLLASRFQSADFLDLWKILLPTLLLDVKEVIVSDLNMQIVGDIGVLWNKMLEMQQTGTHLGMVKTDTVKCFEIADYLFKSFYCFRAWNLAAI